MSSREQFSEYIDRTTTPYKDIYTTVCAVKTEQGALLFDSASFSEDIAAYLLPFLRECGIGKDDLKYVFISHNHTDHAGGLKELLRHFPDLTVISGSAALREAHPETKFLDPGDGGVILDVLQCVTIPGHTQDSAALLDTRTGTLIAGDCLQLWGIFGSGKWGSNIRFPAEHMLALEKLRHLDISCILAAHDYHPMGHVYRGTDEVRSAIDACAAPLRAVAQLIRQNPDSSDEDLCARYNVAEHRPTLGAHVVTAVREALAAHGDLF